MQSSWQSEKNTLSLPAVSKTPQIPVHTFFFPQSLKGTV